MSAATPYGFPLVPPWHKNADTDAYLPGGLSPRWPLMRCLSHGGPLNHRARRPLHPAIVPWERTCSLLPGVSHRSDVDAVMSAAQDYLDYVAWNARRLTMVRPTLTVVPEPVARPGTIADEIYYSPEPSVPVKLSRAGRASVVHAVHFCCEQEMTTGRYTRKTVDKRHDPEDKTGRLMANGDRYHVSPDLGAPIHTCTSCGRWYAATIRQSERSVYSGKPGDPGDMLWSRKRLLSAYKSGTVDKGRDQHE